MVRKPKAFLMDEPLSNLDAQLRLETRAELIELQRRLATTFLYVTHDQVEAMTMGHRIVVLSHGTLQQTGTPREVYERPANTFVAGFLGSPPMNLLTARVVTGAGASGAGQLELEVGGPPAGRIKLREDFAAAVGDGARSRLIVGLRPEHLRLDPEGPLAVTVHLVETLGHEHLVTCRTPAGSPIVVRLGDSAVPPSAGEAIRLAPCGPLHLFDAESGARLG